MTKNQRPAKKSASSPNGRPTIGFLTGVRGQFFHHLVWCGVADVAREHNINAICFEGNYVYDSEGFNAQANILYDLIDAEQLDGLVMWELMCTMLDPDGTRQFYDRYRSLPMVSIGGRLIEGITVLGPTITEICIQHGDVKRVKEWRNAYHKPVINDECEYEGNIPPGCKIQTRGGVRCGASGQALFGAAGSAQEIVKPDAKIRRRIWQLQIQQLI